MTSSSTESEAYFLGLNIAKISDLIKSRLSDFIELVASSQETLYTSTEFLLKNLTEVMLRAYLSCTNSTILSNIELKRRLSDFISPPILIPPSPHR